MIDKERATVKKRIDYDSIKLSTIWKSKGEIMYEMEFNDKKCMIVSPTLIPENLVSRIEETNSILITLDQIVGIQFQGDPKYSQIEHQDDNTKG